MLFNCFSVTFNGPVQTLFYMNLLNNLAQIVRLLIFNLEVSGSNSGWGHRLS
jgi:hypothetical protein